MAKVGLKTSVVYEKTKIPANFYLAGILKINQYMN